MKDYVISYTYLKQDHKVIWRGFNANNALISFWASFDEVDAKKVSNVRIFDIVEIVPFID